MPKEKRYSKLQQIPVETCYLRFLILFLKDWTIIWKELITFFTLPFMTTVIYCYIQELKYAVSSRKRITQLNIITYFCDTNKTFTLISSFLH